MLSGGLTGKISGTLLQHVLLYTLRFCTYTIFYLMVYDYNACMTYIHNDNIKIEQMVEKMIMEMNTFPHFCTTTYTFHLKEVYFHQERVQKKKKHLKKKMCFTVVLISSVFSRDMERSLENPESILDVEGYSQIILWKQSVLAHVMSSWFLITSLFPACKYIFCITLENKRTVNALDMQLHMRQKDMKQFFNNLKYI